MHQKHNPNDHEFKVVLIGLDGGMKLSQNNILTAENLFSKIDSMPLRNREIKTAINKNLLYLRKLSIMHTLLCFMITAL
ncbi:DUF4174 domain-containing protein [Winogradskyella luteola]|uniref:DUF4174 domain-containing protein n=1 Tax=Winogradskyella luteola TaxID=2828330 RepID=UPI0034E95AF3